MAKPTGFMEYRREDAPKREVNERIRDFREIETLLPLENLQQQAARCMDCGVPSCHAYGCPVMNRIPDWNDMVYRGQWEIALQLLHSTNNFPEITGRICPAPCEAACTLSINQPAVTIKQIELQIVEHGWRNGWIVPECASIKSGKRVAIIGSGPTGLSAAQQLARKGHEVVVFEKDDRIGGLLQYGIPDFKLEKYILERRIEQMQAEGVRFETEVNAGFDISPRFMRRSFDAILIAAGATVPRDIPIPGRELQGVHFAMEFLTQQNRKVAELDLLEKEISAKDKDVVVIGGGDTGSDCVGTSKRQGAKSITQIEILSKPPKERDPQNPWPEWPNTMRTSTSHEEGCERMWRVLTKAFQGEHGDIKGLDCVKVDWKKSKKTGQMEMKEQDHSSFRLNADLVLISAGFVHVEHGSLVTDFDLNLDDRGHIVVDSNFMTNSEGVFAAGDSVLGASLVVRAFYQGRAAAEGIHSFLT